MDRQIVYAGTVPLDTDFLAVQRHVLVALGFLGQATFGPGPVFDGFACTVIDGTMSVNIGPGMGTAITPLDPQGFGALPAGVGSILALGCNTDTLRLDFAVPTGAGMSQAWLIQACVAEQDTAPVVLPYWNAANPAVPYSGPGGNGAAQPTQRVQRVLVTAKSGTTAPTGTQTVPSPDEGWTGLYTITIASGTTSLSQAQIVRLPAAPFLSWRLPQLRPGFSQRVVITTSGTFVVPPGVNRVNVRLIGGGGGGGGVSISGQGGGGGGAGGYVEGMLSLQPGQVIPVTVGVGGAGSVEGSAVWGGTSSFGSYMSGTGGIGGVATGQGGGGGYAYGGDFIAPGGCGADGQSTGYVFPGNGGSGAFGGGGRGTNGANGVSNGIAYGSGGGGCYLTPGNGGNGANGVVIVEF